MSNSWNNWPWTHWHPLYSPPRLSSAYGLRRTLPASICQWRASTHRPQSYKLPDSREFWGLRRDCHVEYPDSHERSTTQHRPSLDGWWLWSAGVVAILHGTPLASLQEVIQHDASTRLELGFQTFDFKSIRLSLGIAGKFNHLLCNIFIDTNHHLNWYFSFVI